MSKWASSFLHRRSSSARIIANFLYRRSCTFFLTFLVSRILSPAFFIDVPSGFLYDVPRLHEAAACMRQGEAEDQKQTISGAGQSPFRSAAQQMHASMARVRRSSGNLQMEWKFVEILNPRPQGGSYGFHQNLTVSTKPA